MDYKTHSCTINIDYFPQLFIKLRFKFCRSFFTATIKWRYLFEKNILVLLSSTFSFTILLNSFDFLEYLFLYRICCRANLLAILSILALVSLPFLFISAILHKKFPINSSIFTHLLVCVINHIP